MDGPELNEAISNARGFKYVGRGMMVREHLTQTICDYYNNWNDLMPLVEKYGISSLHQNCDNSWMTDQFHGDAIVAGDNLQRAYCECLLKVLIEGKVK